MDKKNFIFSEKKDGQIFKVINKSNSYDCKEVTLQDYKNVKTTDYKEYLILSGQDFEKTYRVIEYFSNKEGIKNQIKFIEKKSEFDSLWYKDLKVEKKPIDECSNEKSNIFLTPMDQFNFKSIIESNNVQQDLYLKAIFHLILGAYDIGENGPNDSMFISYLNYSFENLYLISSPSSSNNNNNNYDFKLTYPFINIQPDSSTTNIKSNPFFKSIVNYIDFKFSDTLLNDIIIKMNNQNLSRIHFLFVIKKIIKIIIKEKDRLLDKFPNSNLDVYFEQFEASILFDEQKSFKMNLPNKIDPFKTIKFSSFKKTYKSDTGLLYLVNIKEKEYGVEIYQESQIKVPDIEINGKKSQPMWENNHFKYFDYCRDKDKKLVYIIYQLPTNFNISKCDNGFSNNNLSKDKKDKLFYRLIENHISNFDITETNVKKSLRDIDTLKNYSLNLIISNEEKLFYSYSFNTKSNSNFIDSIYDIGKWVYGKNSEEINQLQSIKLLQHLLSYNNIELIHHQLKFSFSNIYNIIRKNLSGFKKIIPEFKNKLQNKHKKYSIIKIDEDYYYIKNLSSPFENHNDFYKTIILTLEKTITGDKLICFRNQNNSQLFGSSSLELKKLSGSAVKCSNVKPPIFTVKDSNTSFTLFGYHQVITLNRFILEFGHLSFLKSLLFYLKKLNENLICDNEMILINLSVIFGFECDSYLLFDIREFAEKYFNIIYGWDETILNSHALISQFIIFNDSTIKQDKLTLDFYEQIYN
ncbi:hypothetical protein ACTFIW_003575 [Dictyostelium discoideum]